MAMTKTRSVESLTFELMARKHAKAIGRRIRERRDELGMSQGDVAGRMPPKVDAQRVSKWERGVNKPDDENLELLAAALETTIARFVMDEPEPGTPDLMGAISGAPDGAGQLDRIEAMLAEVLRLLKQPGDPLGLAATLESLRAHQEPARTEPREPAATAQRRRRAG